MKNLSTRRTQYETTTSGVIRVYVDDVDVHGIRGLLSFVSCGTAVEMFETLEAGWRFMHRWEGSGEIVARSEHFVCIKPGVQGAKRSPFTPSPPACWWAFADLGVFDEQDRSVALEFLDSIDEAGGRLHSLAFDGKSTLVRPRQADAGNLWRELLR